MSRRRRSAARSICEAPRDFAPLPEAERGEVPVVPFVLLVPAGAPGRVAGAAAMDSVARPPVPLVPRPPSAEPGVDGPDAGAAGVADAGSPAGDASEADDSSGEAASSRAPV